MPKRKWTHEDVLRHYKDCKSYLELARKLGIGRADNLKKYCERNSIDTSHFTRDKANWSLLPEIVPACFSYAQVLLKLDLAPYGSNYQALKSRLKELSINTAHFLGQAHMAGKTHFWNTKLPLSEILVKDTKYGGRSKASSSLRKRLIREKILENKCSFCSLTDWQGKVITLHLDHINGDRADARIENLRLLCPNCHSQTETYCGKNKKRKERSSSSLPKRMRQRTIRFCNSCKSKEIDLDNKTGFCIGCRDNYTVFKINWPNKEELEKLVKTYSMVKLAKKLGVSDNAIRKHCKKLGIQPLSMSEAAKLASVNK